MSWTERIWRGFPAGQQSALNGSAVLWAGQFQHSLRPNIKHYFAKRLYLELQLWKPCATKKEKKPVVLPSFSFLHPLPNWRLAQSELIQLVCRCPLRPREVLMSLQPKPRWPGCKLLILRCGPADAARMVEPRSRDISGPVRKSGKTLSSPPTYAWVDLDVLLISLLDSTFRESFPLQFILLGSNENQLQVNENPGYRKKNLNCFKLKRTHCELEGNSVHWKNYENL